MVRVLRGLRPTCSSNSRRSTLIGSVSRSRAGLVLLVAVQGLEEAAGELEAVLAEALLGGEPFGVERKSRWRWLQQARSPSPAPSDSEAPPAPNSRQYRNENTSPPGDSPPPRSLTLNERPAQPTTTKWGFRHPRLSRYTRDPSSLDGWWARRDSGCFAAHVRSRRAPSLRSRRFRSGTRLGDE